jgi:hypothetical protein
MSQADLRARILAEVKKEPAPTRAEHRRRVLLVAFVGAAATAAIFFATGGFTPGTRPLEMIAFTAGLAAFTAGVLTRLSSGGGTSSVLGHPRQVIVGACVVAAPLLAIAALVAAMCWPGPAGEPVSPGAHFSCAALALLQGALPLVALLAPKRGSDPIHPAITGAGLGMTAGAWTAMLAYLRCPHASAFHCMVAHVGPTVLLTVVGAALGWALLRIKR